MLAVLFITFLITLFLGVPIAYAMGISSLIALISADIPLTIVAQRVFSGVNSFALMAIPFFMLSGEFMERGGISSRLVKFASTLVGHLRGGLGHVGILSSIIFAGISGSASADTSAVGSIMIPSQVKKGYPKGYAASIQAIAGALGPIIPPSIIMIIYGSITGLSIGKLFLAGAIPGLLMGIGIMVVHHFQSIKHGFEREARATLKQIVKSAFDAIFALLAPVVIVGGIISGIFTATEAGAIAAFYCFVIGYFVYKEFKLSEIPEMVINATRSTAMVMIIASFASIFGWILANEQFPEIATNLLLSVSSNPNVVMLLVILFLFIVGCFVETIAAAVILIPVLDAIGVNFGFDPIQWATVIAVCLVLGGVTPPVGVLLFITSSIAKCSLSETVKYVTPFLLVFLLVVLLMAFIPSLTTFLPNALMP